MKIGTEKLSRTSIRTIFLVLGMISAISGWSQNHKKIEGTHAINLKNGSVLIGEVELYAEGQPVRIRMSEGEIITIDFNSVAGISKVNKKALRKLGTIENSKERTYIFKEKGFHYNGAIGVIENGGHLNGSVNLSVNIGAFYQFSNYFGLGLYSGYESYDIGFNQEIIPVFVSLQGFPLSTRISPFYSLGIGYGIALQQKDSNNSTEGGLLIYPKIGVRLGTKIGTNFSIFGGMKIQESKIDYQIFGGSEEFLIQERTLKRIIFGIGVIF